MASSLAYSEILEPKKNNKTKRNRQEYTNKTKITTNYLKEKVDDIAPFDSNEEEDAENTKDMFPENPEPARMVTKDYTDGLLDKNKHDYGIPLESQEKENEPVKNYFMASNKTEPFGMASTQINDDELNRKLSYLIHLIEDQHDEKIKSVTEEVILYGFLGVFIIYVLDSFTKIGKYVR